MSTEHNNDPSRTDEFGEVLAQLPDSYSITQSGNSIYSTIPKTVRDVHGIEEIEDLDITVTSKGWFVEPVPQTENDD